jgi:hypothetical protein
MEPGQRASRKKNAIDWTALKQARDGKVSLLDQVEVIEFEYHRENIIS